MTIHSGIFAWKMPWTGEPGRLQFKGLQSVTRDRLSMLAYCLDCVEISFFYWSRVDLQCCVSFSNMFLKCHRFILHFSLFFNIIIAIDKAMCVCSTMSDSFLNPMNCSPPVPLSLRFFPHKNTGVSCHFLLQGIFRTQESKLCLLCLLHWQSDSSPLCHLGFP